MDRRLFISFSGGKTSGYTAWLVLSWMRQSYDEIVCGLANTGQEREETLVFIDRCDKAFGLNLVWLEADVNPEPKKGTRHKVVSFETANRDGSVFESSIAKYGIPNPSYSNCTRELKLAPINSYLRSIGWKAGSYDTAIGIRADEFDRMDENRKAKRFWYPLVEKNITKAFVNDWWNQQAFNLELKEHQGNCKWCWKKSTRKLLTLVKESPEVFDFPRRMEAKYSHLKAPHGRRVFFRKERTVQDLFDLAEKPFTPFIENVQLEQGELDLVSTCEESCNAYE